MEEECVAFSSCKKINVAIDKVFISRFCYMEQVFDYTIIQP